MNKTLATGLIFLLAYVLTGGYSDAQAPVHVFVAPRSEFSDAHDGTLRISLAPDPEHANLFSSSSQQTSTVDLAWPLQPVLGFGQFNYNGVSNFVDHDPRYPDSVQDYTCGARTYDLAGGYNHAGTDYFLWPYPWLMMDDQEIRVVAAASGTLRFKTDGHFDRSCALSGEGAPNEVDVQQDDGLTALYLHLRSGSVTTQPIGARVHAGDYLGTVGSSGNSTAPHLHFELRDASDNVVDPRHGACNAAPDRWLVTQDYEEPKIVSLTTHSAEPAFVDCGVDATGANLDESPNIKSAFAPGDDLWVFAAWRDQRNGELTAFSITRPDGTSFATWNYDLASAGYPKPFYAGTGSDWHFSIATDAPVGTWKLTAQFQNLTYTTPFTVVSDTVNVRSIAIGGYLSGNWYDPDQSGTGFQIEVAKGGVMIAIWFAFEPTGGQPVWIFSEGTYDGRSNSVTLPATVSTGAKFPPSYSESDRTIQPWGSLTFTFSDCNHAIVAWTSELPGYASGSFAISRLTQIDGTECPASP